MIYLRFVKVIIHSNYIKIFAINLSAVYIIKSYILTQLSNVININNLIIGIIDYTKHSNRSSLFACYSDLITI